MTLALTLALGAAVGLILLLLQRIIVGSFPQSGTTSFLTGVAAGAAVYILTLIFQESLFGRELDLVRQALLAMGGFGGYWFPWMVLFGPRPRR